MCPRASQSVMATCACGDEAGHKFQTFGQLMEEVLAGADARGSPLVRPPSVVAHALSALLAAPHTAAQQVPCMTLSIDLVASAVSALLSDAGWAKAAELRWNRPVQARVPKGFKTALFGRVWNRPLCSLFAWRNATDFAGTCDELPSTCLEKKWCAATA